MAGRRVVLIEDVITTGGPGPGRNGVDRRVCHQPRRRRSFGGHRSRDPGSAHPRRSRRGAILSRSQNPLCATLFGDSPRSGDHHHRLRGTVDGREPMAAIAQPGQRRALLDHGLLADRSRQHLSLHHSEVLADAGSMRR